MSQSIQQTFAAINGRWTKLEHQKFLLGLQMYGKNWKKIEQLIKTRNGSQIRSHAQKFFLKVKNTAQGHQNQSNSVQHNQVPSTFLNSKSTCQNDKNNQGHSIFFQQILKRSKYSPSFDMWMLIDTKDAQKKHIQRIQIQNQQQQKQNLSFEAKRKSSFNKFQDCQKLKNIPRKIIKTETNS